MGPESLPPPRIRFSLLRARRRIVDSWLSSAALHGSAHVNSTINHSSLLLSHGCCFARGQGMAIAQSYVHEHIADSGFEANEQRFGVLAALGAMLGGV